MALQSKTISAKGSRGHHTFSLTVTEDSTNVSANESILSFEFKLVDDNNWFWSAQGTYVSYKITIGSHTYEGYIPHHTSVTTEVRRESDVTELHNSDGTKTINIGFTVTDSSSISYLPGNASASSTMALTTIPRASGVSVGNVTISSTSGSLSATINPQASFWHRWKYVIGSYDSGWTNMSSAISSATSISVAYTTILSKITASSSGTVVFTVETHNSNAFNSSSYIGTASATSTVTITLKPSAPTLTTLGFRSRSSGVNSNITTPTAGYTTVALTSWSNGTSSGATSYTTYFSVDQGASLKTTSATANNTVIETNTLPSSAKQYTLTYTAYTVDSRGNKSSNATKTVVVYGYSTPTLNLTAYRVASSSATTEDATGTYAYVTFSNTMRGQTDANGALRSGNQNAIVSATCKYGSTTVTSGQHIALAVESTLTFTYTVQDRFTTTSTTRTVNSASFPLDLYDNGSGSVGVGVGTIAVANKVTSALPIEVGGSVKANSLHSAHIFTTSGSSGYVKIRINSLVNWMLSFTVCIYANYNQIQLRVSGYNYFIANQHWYSPRALLLSTSELVNLSVTFGYDTDDYLWVCIPVGTYYGVDIVDVTNGHYQVIDTVDELFTLTEVSSIPTTVQATVTATLSAITSTNANNVYVTATNPTSATTYYVPFHSGVGTGNKALCDNNGLAYTTLEGTTSALGYGCLVLGNNAQSGTAGNKYGRIQLYDRYNHKVDIMTTNNMGDNRTIRFPDQGGILAIHDVTIWTGSLTGTNSIDLDISAYKRIRIYALYYDNRQMIWEVDVTKLHATTQYRCNHCEMSWLDNGWYHTIFETFISKARFTLSNVYNMNISGTTYAQNNSTAYQIYQIDGIL